MSTRIKRHLRVRKKITGTSKLPRLSVYRSNKSMYVQAIDDVKGVTIVGLKDSTLKLKGTKVERAKELGLAFGKELSEKKIKKVVFDRGGYRYHGRVKSFADAVRETGIVF